LLNLNFIREHADIVRKAAADKNVSLDLDALLQLDGEVREAKTRVDTLRAQRNEVSSRFKDAAPEQKKELGAQSKLIASEIASTEELLKGREAELSGLLLRIPNIPGKALPSARTKIRTW
jgi:seryl-tRNA synthetase